jgi:hypothetical protein
LAPSPGAFLIAATPLDPPVDGKCWAFHLINDSTERLESVTVASVDYEWGDLGNGVSPETRYGPVAPGSSLEVWRDDDNAAELRMSITLLLRGAGGERRITVEFGKLYRTKRLVAIPILGMAGIPGSTTVEPTAEPPIGAVEVTGPGEDFRRTREILQERVRSYNLPLDGALLRSLARFGLAHESLRPAVPLAFTSALDALVHGCRRASFDRGLDREDVLPAAAQDAGEFGRLPPKEQAGLRELKEALGVLHRELLEVAEAQEWSDARLNAIEFRKAAADVARAREHLERGFRRPG